MWRKIRGFVGEVIFFVLFAPVTLLGWIPFFTGMDALWYMGLLVVLGIGFAWLMAKG